MAYPADLTKIEEMHQGQLARSLPFALMMERITTLQEQRQNGVQQTLRWPEKFQLNMAPQILKTPWVEQVVHQPDRSQMLFVMNQ